MTKAVRFGKPSRAVVLANAAPVVFFRVVFSSGSRGNFLLKVFVTIEEVQKYGI